jgi:S-adenosylmethionine decarboxylase
VRSFLIQGVLWNIVFFGLIRLAWVDRHFTQALVAFQQAIVNWYAGAPRLGLVVTSDCSGADVMALCAAVTLAYPVAWTRRIAGVVAGIGLIVAFNIVRIATLYRASTPATLEWLHRVVWPVALVIVTIAYVLWWIRRSERNDHRTDGTIARMTKPLVVLGLAYAATVPWAFVSGSLQRAGVWTVTCATMLTHAFGVEVHGVGNVLVTSRGNFQVTPECLFTPILPIYLAAVWAWPMAWRRRTAWILAAVPLFLALGVVRLLALALPPLVVSHPTFLAHGFYQLIMGLVAIVGAAHLAAWRRPGRSTTGRTVIAIGSALGAAVITGPLWQRAIVALAGLVHDVWPSTVTVLAGPNDQQGALAVLPVYQFALVVGLWMALTSGKRWRSAIVALAALALSQVIFFAAIGGVSAAFQIEPHALVVRGWALAVPLVMALVWANSHATSVGDKSYLRFWGKVGDEFPSLTGARSTRFYFENEKRLITDVLPVLAGTTILKTDLWDEAKNTRILQWMADQGAVVYGIDISEPIVREARSAFGHRPMRPAVSDVRRLPFAAASFDAIYSMGTVEHFAETQASVRELARVLRPGGRLILGVPNRHDPFLRPAVVALLSVFGLYDYGFEKSFSRAGLRRLLEHAGLRVESESGILFVPGWLRMLDLWCHTRVPALTRLTAALLQPFVWLDAHVPVLRRHGYLIASVGVKSAAPDVSAGVEYVVDARGCDPDRLRSQARLDRLFQAIVSDLNLNAVAAPLWHVFPDPGGITGVTLLTESHLAIHTYPEAGLATINLYCCRGPLDWAWSDRLRDHLGAGEVTVRALPRG